MAVPEMQWAGDQELIGPSQENKNNSQRINFTEGEEN
jgi:hypothetical protein